jgi:hypothetical protein
MGSEKDVYFDPLATAFILLILLAVRLTTDFASQMESTLGAAMVA